MGTVRENPRRRLKGGEGAGVDLIYSCLGYADEAAAETALLAAAPTTHLGLLRKSWTVDEQGSTNWEGTVTYSKAGELTQNTQPETGYSEYSFDLTGGTQHIQHGLSTAGGFTNLATMPDFGGAIGVSRNGNSVNVDGCDVVVPSFEYSETHYVDAADIDAAYIQTLKGLTGSVNNGTFKGFSTGEVLFLGARGSQRGNDDWRVDYLFRISANVTGRTIGDITAIAKAGHDYLWVLHEEVEGGDMIQKYPVAVYVEKVYPDGNFAGLGIGT